MPAARALAHVRLCTTSAHAWAERLNRLELTRRLDQPVSAFIAVEAIECCERLRRYELAREWQRSSKKSAIELMTEVGAGAAHLGDADESAGVAQGEPVEPIALAPLAPGGAPVQLHGIHHSRRDRRLIEAIVTARPAVVALESARDDSAVGAELERADACLLGLVADELADLHAAGPAALLRSAEWARVCAAMPATEALAIVGAWASGARVVHIDRPKRITWARCLAEHTAAELDRLFAERVRTQRPHARTVLDERDSVMCAALRELWLTSAAAAQADGEGGAAGGPVGAIVGVVGQAHVEPIRELWARAASDATTATQLAGAVHALTAEPPAASMDGAAAEEEAGLKYALLDAVYAPSATPSRHLPPLPPRARDAYARARALYASAEMQLAVLPRETLHAHVAASHAAELGEARASELAGAIDASLAGLRALRPSEGGRGMLPDAQQQA